MKIAELAQVVKSPLKVLSARTGRVLCHRYDPERHKSIGQMNTNTVWADLMVSDSPFGDHCYPIMCAYAYGEVSE